MTLAKYFIILYSVRKFRPPGSGAGYGSILIGALIFALHPIQTQAVSYIAHRDIYHIYKHKRRMCPQCLRPEERELSLSRTGLHALHRKLTKPWRYFRRWFLRKQYETGRLRSPTADLEDHYQPEKDGWRRPRQGQGDRR